MNDRIGKVKEDFSILDDCLTPEEVANELGLNTEYVRQLIRYDQIKGFKVGHFWLIHKDEVQKYKAKKTE